MVIVMLFGIAAGMLIATIALDTVPYCSYDQVYWTIIALVLCLVACALSIAIAKEYYEPPAKVEVEQHGQLG